MSDGRALIRLLPPGRVHRLFAFDDPRALILGDCAFVQPPVLDAVAYYAWREQATVFFWGRAARLNADRAAETLGERPSPPRMRAFARFEPIDLLEDAEAIASAVAVRGGALAILDAEILLDARLIAALEDIARIAVIE